MSRRVGHNGLSFALRASVLAVSVVAATSGCASGERAEREREVAAVRSQLDELRKGQEANAKELARLSGEMKALDAQSAFLVGEVKAASEERARVKAALEESDKAVRELRSSLQELSKVTPPPASPPAPAPQSSTPDASPEQIYAAALASLQADEHERAVAEFTELTKKFPEHPLASSAQYWIGEAYYRQQEFSQALGEFQKVINGYPKSPQIPEALLKIGLCYRSLRDQPRAREVWEQVTKQYPGTNAANQARSLLAASSEGANRPAR
jgi:tol-pal system protein YbgF